MAFLRVSKLCELLFAPYEIVTDRPQSKKRAFQCFVCKEAGGKRSCAEIWCIMRNIAWGCWHYFDYSYHLQPALNVLVSRYKNRDWKSAYALNSRCCNFLRYQFWIILQNISKLHGQHNTNTFDSQNERQQFIYVYDRGTLVRYDICCIIGFFQRIAPESQWGT